MVGKDARFAEDWIAFVCEGEIELKGLDIVSNGETTWMYDSRYAPCENRERLKKRLESHGHTVVNFCFIYVD